ncbi:MULTISPECIES: CBS and ACT domain-containing protein [Tessaracoccus]|uniref:CBS and ACT domain-containing protein n=2 Tax=Tessaracoccus TaxID=72763 RepID=A0ABY8PUJ6_9ACTN|nr:MULTISPECIES: CBS and ACT domain-containing protein [Tessaracoccus]QXT64034.1 CBS and ACT domain-containing protein [Tessaracoccus palaemonis]WGT46110.1 CBS and ACT domain-containing protein [Tessaracoccus sp. T21]
MLVKTRMTATPFTVTSATKIPEALEVMTSNGVRHLPVVDEGRVTGVISKNDIAAASPSKATTLSAQEATYLIAKLTVGKVMSRPAITIGPDTLLEEAAVLMRDEKIEILPVVADGALVGVITESDLLDAYIDILGFRDPGTRLTIEAKDEPGVLSLLTGITAKHQANISHLAVHRGQLDHSIVVVGLNTPNTAAIEEELTSAGMRILRKLVNPRHP